VPPAGDREEIHAGLLPAVGEAAGSAGVTGRLLVRWHDGAAAVLMLGRKWNRLSAKALAGLSRSTRRCGPPSRERTRLHLCVQLVRRGDETRRDGTGRG
jgi:hypothetical protein